MISATYIDHMGGDDAVVDAARASFDRKAKDFQPEKNGALIRYLAKHDHWSPFSHVVVKIDCRAPLFIARQAWKSHVGFNGGDAGSANGWNEESRRYVDAEPEFWYPDNDEYGNAKWRKRAENVKQGSSHDTLDGYPLLGAGIAYNRAMDACRDAYYTMLEHGVAPEQARAVLPMATMVSWTWTGSLAAWARFCKLRQDSHAQREIQDLSAQISDICQGIAPVSWAALKGEISRNS